MKERELSPVERIVNRLGYMGTGFFITAPHLLPETPGIVIYFLAGLFCTPQVWVAKQWNLVLVNLNVMVAYALLFFNNENSKRFNFSIIQNGSYNKKRNATAFRCY